MLRLLFARIQRSHDKPWRSGKLERHTHAVYASHANAVGRVGRSIILSSDR